jgi:PAS domain S-box-containing protein
MNFVLKFWKQLASGCFLLAVAFSLASFAYIQQQNIKDNTCFKTYAEIIKNDTWALNRSGIKSYLQLAVQGNKYKSLAVLLEKDALFIRITSPELSGLDHFLYLMHLIPLKELSTDIVYKNRLIGSLHGEQYVRVFYPLLNIFFLIAVFLPTSLFILNLFYDRRFLEQQIFERTQRHRASERRFHDLVNLLPEMVCETDLQGNLTYGNKIALQQLKITKSVLLESSLFKYIVPEQVERAKNNFKHLVQGHKQKLNEYTACTADGVRFPVLARSAPIYAGNDIIGIRSVIVDITERCSLEKKLQRAQRMEVIGLMAGGVAHDLNNILSGVINYPELILNKLPHDSELRGQVKAIKKTGLRAAEVVSDLLTVARGVAAPRTITPPNKIITEYLQSPEFLQLQSRHQNISWQTDLDPAALNISCSPIHVKKSVMNLIINAAEAITGTGRVTISTAVCRQDHPGEQEEGISKKCWSVISIHDTGEGIADKDLDHIFDPFYTKKVMGKSGSGLGLTVVWNTIQDHDGEIRVNSDDDGTTFSLFFPASEQNFSQLEPTEELKVLMGGGEKVLVVDDNPQQQDIALQLLTSLNYKVSVVSSGEEAVEYLRTSFVHILLLDMLMPPGLNGLQTYKQILTIHPGQKAVIVSGFSENNDVRETLQLGAASYIKKPYVMEQLSQVMYNALH